MRHGSVVSRYAIPTSIPQVDDWSTRPPGFRASQYVMYRTSISSKSTHNLSRIYTICISKYIKYTIRIHQDEANQ